MSVAGYFAVGKDGRRWDDRLVVQMREQIFGTMKPLDEGAPEREVYQSLEDYDPVLRAHCRLDKK